MYIRFARFLAAFISIIIFFSGCGPKKSIGPDEVKVVFTDKVDKSSKRPAVEMPNFLEDVTFIPDSDGAKKVVFKNKETVLQVTDASGLTWKLTIPGNALLKEETITMTPLKDVKDANGRELSGVLLEPDGLQFIAPATLTVTGEGSEKGWIYNADHRGKEPKLSMVKPVKGGIESRILHFSSAVMDKGNPLTDPEKKNEIDRQIKKIIPEIKEMLEEDAELPTPPTIELECLDDEKLQEASEYRKEVFDEEFGYAHVLSTAYTVYKTAGDPMAEEIKPLMDQMLNRVRVKLDAFFQKYSPDPERFFVAIELFRYDMATFGHGMLSEAASEGGFSDAVEKAAKEKLEEIAKRMGNWAEHTMKYIIEQIRTEHNYKVISAASFCYLFSGFVDPNNRENLDGNKELLEELRKAFTFKVAFEGKITDKDEKGTVTWNTKGEALVQLEDGEAEKPVLNGEGVGMHTDYKAPDHMVQVLLTKDFPIKARVYLGPCKEQAAVLIDRLGASELTYEADGQEYTFPSLFNWFELYLEDNYIKEDSMLAVIVDFESGEAQFEEDLEGSMESAEISYTIKLVHSPQ